MKNKAVREYFHNSLFIKIVQKVQISDANDAKYVICFSLWFSQLYLRNYTELHRGIQESHREYKILCGSLCNCIFSDANLKHEKHDEIDAKDAKNIA